MQLMPIIGIVAALSLLAVLPTQGQTAQPPKSQAPPPAPVYQLYLNGAQCSLEAVAKELASAD
ncbi:MAG: hypothetical protein JWN14_4763, partial [Chthonomonadales bacterium]|nr:hypothetical protein [Chthonomonadales bacterium]